MGVGGGQHGKRRKPAEPRRTPMSKSKREGRKPITNLTTVQAKAGNPTETPTEAESGPDSQKGLALVRRAAAHLQASNPEAARLLRELAPAKPPKAPKPPKPQQPVCGEPKKDGTLCTARCKEGKDTCVDHQPAWDRLSHEEHQAFGEWLRAARGPEIVEVIGWWKAKQIAKDQQQTKAAAQKAV